jgi:hypothetical protein
LSGKKGKNNDENYTNNHALELGVCITAQLQDAGSTKKVDERLAVKLSFLDPGPLLRLNDRQGFL